MTGLTEGGSGESEFGFECLIFFGSIDLPTEHGGEIDCGTPGTHGSAGGGFDRICHLESRDFKRNLAVELLALTEDSESGIREHE